MRSPIDVYTSEQGMWWMAIGLWAGALGVATALLLSSGTGYLATLVVYPVAVYGGSRLGAAARARGVSRKRAVVTGLAAGALGMVVGLVVGPGL